MNKISDLLGEESNWFQDNIVQRAPALMALFANAVVIIADYRAYDVLYVLTASWWKALFVVLGACAIPFLLWEISFQYNHTTDFWRVVSLLMSGLAFVTSLILGVADYLGFDGVWSDILLGGGVVVGGIHAVVGFLYYYNDPDVARKRRKAQTLAMMADQQSNTDVAKMLLANGKDVLAIINSLKGQYNPDDVDAVLAILRGKKENKNAPTLTRQYASKTDFTQGRREQD
jgi:hypothetical protein